MTRLPLISVDQLSDADREILARPINLHRTLANNTHLARPFVALGAAIRHDGVLDPRLRELAILQVGYLTSSPYEVSHHIKIGRDFGVSDSDIRAVIAETQGQNSELGALERLVLKAAREVTSQFRMSDETWEALTEHLDNEKLVELGVVIAFYSAVVRVLATFDVEVEKDYTGYLESFPLIGLVRSTNAQQTTPG